MFSLVSCWFEPFENGVAHSRRALRGPDRRRRPRQRRLHAPRIRRRPAPLRVLARTSSWPSVEEGLAFEQRTGGEQAGLWLDEYRWLVGGPRRDAAASGRRSGADQPPRRQPAVAQPRVRHPRRRGRDLRRRGEPGPAHRAAALAGVPRSSAGRSARWPTRSAGWRWPGGCARRPTATAPTCCASWTPCMPWLVARAADAPDNFLHLLHLVEAELAWTRERLPGRRGELRRGAARGDRARQRPWQRGAHHRARGALPSRSWPRARRLRPPRPGAGAATGRGARRRRPSSSTGRIRGRRGPARRRAVTAGAVDLVGILSASQALSSETSMERLHHRVVEVVSAMTGATGVRLLAWSDERNGWCCRPAARRPAGDEPAAPDVGAAVRPANRRAAGRRRRRRRRAVRPRPVLRRPGPVLAAGACRSSAAAGCGRSSLLENRLIRGAFSTDRLDAINLIAGQLAVSLDNAELYARFRLIADEQAALRRVAVLVAQGAVAGGGVRCRGRGARRAARRGRRVAVPARGRGRAHRARPLRTGARHVPVGTRIATTGRACRRSSGAPCGRPGWTATPTPEGSSAS